MNILTRLLAKDNKDFKEHMETFSEGTSWYQSIRSIIWVGNAVTVRTTTATKEDRDRVTNIASAVFSWANDKTVQDKLVIKHVVILGNDNKVIVKVKNPMNKQYFKR